MVKFAPSFTPKHCRVSLFFGDIAVRFDFSRGPTGRRLSSLVMEGIIEPPCSIIADHSV